MIDTLFSVDDTPFVFQYMFILLNDDNTAWYFQVTDDIPWYLQVMDLAQNLMKQVPENIDYHATARILSVDPSPLNVVLLQEVSGVKVI